MRWIVPLIVALLGAVLWLPVSGHGRWFVVVLNAGHGLVFAVVAVLCKLGLQSLARFNAVGQYVAAFGIAVGLGAVVEVLQLPIGRDADPWDVWRDALGAWAGLALLAALDVKVSSRRRMAAALSFVVPVLFLAVPVVECANAYLRRAADFPVLADFSRNDAGYFMEASESPLQWGELPEQWSQAPGEHALHVTFVGESYAGVDFFEPAADWTAYREMVLDLTNPSAESLPLVLRVHDAAHDYSYDDRYNRTFVLTPAQRTILAIPLDEIRRGPLRRELDLTKVADFMLFVVMDEESGAPARELFVSRIWLR